MQLNIRKTNNPIRKWAKDLNRHFSKEDVQVAKKKKYEKMRNITNYQRNVNKSILYISQNGHQPKKKKTYLQKVGIEGTYLNKCWRECGKKGNPSYAVGRNVNW